MKTKESKPNIHINLLSGFYYLVSVALFLAGGIYCFFTDLLKTNFTDNIIIQEMTTGQFVIYGVIMAVVALLEAILALNLRRFKRWAKIIALVISSLGLLWAIVAIFAYGGLENLFFIGLHAYFIWILSKRYYGNNYTTK
ncbi:hypothetical protein FF125_02260 [Aureibaculum algae]|uniref:DUF4064 domain-containing protein n=1 Tax=Aureibaculum algae TaxID=2584122 RepID=A0A5B7TQV5_9FLAO|nr:hypothetical protein [Aureibaculum algae]QCX37317.1 hypothetical protein FF125_02260 [Aureibaculum algae]